MKKHIKWLIDEIDIWVNEGIIDAQQGRAIKTRYPAAAEGIAWSRIINILRSDVKSRMLREPSNKI